MPLMSYCPTTGSQQLLTKCGSQPVNHRVFEVIHTPGDSVYDGPLIENTCHANANDYVRSMRRLHDLPVRAGHGRHSPIATVSGITHSYAIGWRRRAAEPFATLHRLNR